MLLNRCHSVPILNASVPYSTRMVIIGQKGGVRRPKNRQIGNSTQQSVQKRLTALHYIPHWPSHLCWLSGPCRITHIMRRNRPRNFSHLSQSSVDPVHHQEFRRYQPVVDLTKAPRSRHLQRQDSPEFLVRSVSNPLMIETQIERASSLMIQLPYPSMHQCIPAGVVCTPDAPATSGEVVHPHLSSLNKQWFQPKP